MGKRDVISTARIASAATNGRIDTTSGPANTPAERHAMFVFRPLAVTPHAIARQVDAQIDAAADRRYVRPSDLRHGDQGTRLRIQLAEQTKIIRDIARQYDHVSLHEAGGETCGRARERLRSRRAPNVLWRHEASCLPRVSGNRNAASHIRLYAIVAKIAIAVESGIVAEIYPISAGNVAPIPRPKL